MFSSNTKAMTTVSHGTVGTGAVHHLEFKQSLNGLPVLLHSKCLNIETNTHIIILIILSHLESKAQNILLHWQKCFLVHEFLSVIHTYQVQEYTLHCGTFFNAVNCRNLEQSPIQPLMTSIGGVLTFFPNM